MNQVEWFILIMLIIGAIIFFGSLVRDFGKDEIDYKEDIRIAEKGLKTIKIIRAGLCEMQEALDKSKLEAQKPKRNRSRKKAQRYA